MRGDAGARTDVVVETVGGSSRSDSRRPRSGGVVAARVPAMSSADSHTTFRQSGWTGHMATQSGEMGVAGGTIGSWSWSLNVSLVLRARNGK